MEHSSLHPFVFLKHFFQTLALHHIVWAGYRFIRERLTGQKERFFANENHFLLEQTANPREHRSLCGVRLLGSFFSRLIPQVFIHNWGSEEAIEYVQLRLIYMYIYSCGLLHSSQFVAEQFCFHQDCFFWLQVCRGICKSVNKILVRSQKIPSLIGRWGSCNSPVPLAWSWSSCTATARGWAGDFPTDCTPTSEYQFIKTEAMGAQGFRPLLVSLLTAHLPISPGWVQPSSQGSCPLLSGLQPDCPPPTPPLPLGRPPCGESTNPWSLDFLGDRPKNTSAFLIK